MLTCIHYIEVYFTPAFLDCVRDNEDFVKLRFVISRVCSTHFIVILAGLKQIVCYTEDFVIWPSLNRGSTIPGRPISVNNCVRQGRKHTNTNIIERVGLESLYAISETILAIIGV